MMIKVHKQDGSAVKHRYGVRTKITTNGSLLVLSKTGKQVGRYKFSEWEFAQKLDTNAS